MSLLLTGATRPGFGKNYIIGAVPFFKVISQDNHSVQEFGETPVLCIASATGCRTSLIEDVSYSRANTLTDQGLDKSPRVFNLSTNGTARCKLEHAGIIYSRDYNKILKT